jgi:predicted ATPase
VSSEPPKHDEWRRVAELFGGALERQPGERAAFLDAARAAPELRREVESLLAAHDTLGPLDRLEAQMDQVRQEALSLRPTRERAAGSGAPAAQDAPRLAPGDRLGRYELRTPLGAGGMGEVYRASDTRLGRDVAIKIVGQRVREHPDALERFEQEARAASALNHPNIITVYDIGEQGSFPYIVMELVEGESLRQMLAGPWPLELLLHVAVQIADGLAAAHERRIVHCDLKPENILVTRQGVAKILDFGTAQFRRLESADDTGRGRRFLGTPGYISPEVISGSAPDVRSDQFAVGAILHELGSGKPLFGGRTPLETLARTVQSDPPALAEVRPELPPAFGAVVARCLAKDPAQRYAATRLILDELRAVRRAVKQLTAAPEAPAPARKASWPAPRTALVGRQRELLELKRLLLDEEARLVTLTGPGGTGKTRLALHLVDELASRFGSRIVFVPLAAISDAGLVASAIAQATGCARAGGTTPLAAAIDALGGSDPALLVLDNFEQVIDAATVISELLAACPELAALVTSREVLRLYGEHDFPVQPLERPDLQQLPGVDELCEYPAVALFVERARSVNAAFRVTAENAAAIAELCARLDGLPLALELAAAQARLLSPEAMLSRLGQRLEMLSGGPRDLPARQQTLRRTLDWSHQLLSPTEQSVFRRLGVFAGGFTLEAAQAVVDPYEKLDADVMACVGALVDKSLLQPAEVVGGEPRFALLETVRAYALEKLASSGEEAKARKAHAAYFLVLAEEGSALVVSEARWLQRFEAEHDNFRAALDWLVQERDADWGLRIALGLYLFWERGEHLSEGRRRLKALIQLDAARPATPQRAKAFFAAGMFAHIQGDAEEGIGMHTRSLEVYRELGDRYGIAMSLNGLAVHRSAHGAFDEARRLLEESLAVWDEVEQQAGAAASPARTAKLQGRLNLARVAKMQGRFAEARGLYQDAAAAFEACEDPLSAAWARTHEGDVAREQGELEAASALHSKALGAFRSLGDRWGIASCSGDLALVACQRGDAAEAARLYREALAGFAELGHRRGVARIIEALACLAAQAGDALRALRLAGAAATLRSRVGAPASSAERAALEARLAPLRERLGAEAARRAFCDGAAMPFDDAVALAAAF